MAKKKKKQGTVKGPPRAAQQRPPQTPQKEVGRSVGPAFEGIAWPILPDPRLMAPLAMQAHFDQTQWWPPERLEIFQLRQLQALIDHAHKTVPFYRDRLHDVAGLALGALTMDAFRQLPILTRTEVQDAGTAFVSRAVPRSHGAVHDIHTSGSTGRPVEIKVTGVTAVFFHALGLRAELWHRRDLFGKLAVVKMLKPGEGETRRGGWVLGMPSGPSVRIDMALPIGAMLDKIIEEDPDYLQIHASTLREMLLLSQRTGRKPSRLRDVRTEAEVVDQDVRDLCAEQWGVRVTDIYSCEELGPMAIECSHGPRYHVQAEACLLEVLDGDGRPCEPGRTGRVIVTSLHNYAAPLIRYELGDFATVGEPCPCGRGLPVLSRIDGRYRNLAVLPSGDKVTPTLNWGRVTVDLPIRQYQLVQKSVDEIEARIVPQRPFTAADEQAFADYFRRGLGHEFPFTFVYVDDIPRQANGKYEIFRCEMAG